MKNAINFYKEQGAVSARGVARSAYDGADYYHPITQDFYRECLGTLYVYDEENNRFVKFKGYIDRSQFIDLYDLRRVMDAHEYIAKLGGIDGANAVLSGFDITAKAISGALELVTASQAQ